VNLRRLWTTPLVALAACSSGTTTTEAVTRDSAGVTIIEHPAGAIAAATVWSVGAPQVTISHGPTDDLGFSWISDAARLADGGIVLVDGEGQSSSLLVYKEDGTFERSIGRAGSGPGEFRFASILATAGDSISLYDGSQARHIRFLTSGALVATNDLGGIGGFGLGQPTGMLADGQLVSATTNFRDPNATEGSQYRRKLAMLIVDPVMSKVDTLSTAIPGEEVAPLSMTVRGQQRMTPSPVGYGDQSFFATSGTEVLVATNTTAALDRYAIPWKLTRSVRFAEARRPVDQAARDALTASMRARIEEMGVSAEMKANYEDAIRRYTIADSMAWYSGMRASTDGSAWLREQRVVTDSVPHYLVVGPDGHLAARVDLPSSARLLWVGGEQLLIAMHDEDDVERLELRPIIKSGTGR